MRYLNNSYEVHAYCILLIRVAWSRTVILLSIIYIDTMTQNIVNIFFSDVYQGVRSDWQFFLRPVPKDQWSTVKRGNLNN